MWVRLVICTRDVAYSERFASFIEREYREKLEISVFSKPEYLAGSDKGRTADVVLFGEEFEPEAAEISQDMPWTWAVLTEQRYESSEDKTHRIAKYQRMDDLYKAVLELYSQTGQVRRLDPVKQENGPCRVYVFLSACGGVGTTAVARAYAGKCVSSGKVLYLDMNILGNGWSREKQAQGMDEILVALKSRRDILPIKLMSIVTDTEEGVSVYAPCREPLHLLEVTGEDVARLIRTVRGLGEYSKVVIDAGTHLSEREFEMIRQADVLVYVAEDCARGRDKYEKLCEVLRMMERREGTDVLRKMVVFRNKAIRNERIEWGSRECGWMPEVEMDSYENVIRRMMQSDAFDNMEESNGG